MDDTKLSSFDTCPATFEVEPGVGLTIHTADTRIWMCWTEVAGLSEWLAEGVAATNAGPDRQ